MVERKLNMVMKVSCGKKKLKKGVQSLGRPLNADFLALASVGREEGAEHSHLLIEKKPMGKSWKVK